MTASSTTRRPTLRRLASRRGAAVVLTAAALAAGGVLVSGGQLTSSAAGTASPARGGLEREAQNYFVSGLGQHPNQVEELALTMGMTAEEAARVAHDCRLRYELRLPPCVCDGDPRY